MALESWNDTPTRSALVSFVERVTREGGPDHVAPQDRVAVFDNDGTLWCEKPMPVELGFIMRRFGEMAAADPSLRDRQPWKAATEGDMHWLGSAITAHYHGDDTGHLRGRARDESWTVVSVNRDWAQVFADD